MTGGPESTNIPQSTTTSSASASATASATNIPVTSSSAPTSSSSSSSSSNAGAIAGGVVGGVVGLALLAALVFWWTRRRRAQLAPSALVDPMAPSPASPAAISFNQTAPLVGTPSTKLYVRSSLSPLTGLTHLRRTLPIRAHSLLRQRLLAPILCKSISLIHSLPTQIQTSCHQLYTLTLIRGPVILVRPSFETAPELIGWPNFLGENLRWTHVG
jgi:hypothetical protein